MSADYTIIRKSPFGLEIMHEFPISLPDGFHVGSRCILSFVLGSIKVNDSQLTLRVRINGELVYSYNTSRDIPGHWAVQQVIASNVLGLRGDGNNHIMFHVLHYPTPVQAKISNVALLGHLETEDEGIPSILRVGGDGDDGEIRVFPANVSNGSSPGKASFWVKAQTAYLRLGGGPSGNSRDGFVDLKGGVKKLSRISLDAHSGPQSAGVLVGGNGASGQVYLIPGWGSHDPSAASIHLNGTSGVITASNVDCAEDFEIEDASSTEPGTVMVISEGLRLRASEQAYDTRVAGIVSGAGDYRPGIILGRRPGGDSQRLPIALMGRVFCRVDADQGVVRVGDLLTTSSVPGHAMKACDPARAFGAVLGKALSPLERGQGLIPVLVALQ